jgi:hypothetical protein
VEEGRYDFDRGVNCGHGLISAISPCRHSLSGKKYVSPQIYRSLGALVNATCISDICAAFVTEDTGSFVTCAG